MSPEKRQVFRPDYSIHPGEILGETLQARSISQAEFASRCGLSEKHVSQIINGKASITSETALTFERVLGTRASLDEPGIQPSAPHCEAERGRQAIVLRRVG